MNTPIIAPSRTAAALRKLVKKITGSSTSAPVTENETSNPLDPSRNSVRSFASLSSFSNPPTRIGKIARIPEAIRAELNHRLRDGLPASKILPWLNALPEVQQVLTEFFDGKPITKANLSLWRLGGFKDEEKRRHETEQVKELALFAAKLTDAQNRHLSRGTMILANAKLLQQLRTMQHEINLDELHKIIRSAATIRRAEIFQERSDTSKGMLKCRERSARLAEKKFKHQVRQDRDQDSSHPGTVSFEDILNASLAPSPTDTAAQPTHGDAANTEDGGAQAPVRPGPPKAPCSENPAATSAGPTPIQSTTANMQNTELQNGTPGGPSRTGQDSPPAKEASPTPILEERQQSYWSNPISMSDQPPTPLPTETKPASTQPLPPKPQTPEEEAESNPVKADQDRCRAKYRAQQLITRQSPENWQTQRIIHCA